MADFVVSVATVACSFGASPCPLETTPLGMPVKIGGELAGTIMDFVPVTNIADFDMCMSPSNPEVAAATAAAMGVLTPQPCIPVTTTPWSPGASTVTINGQPALTATCTATCMWGGEITVSYAGQATVSTSS